MFGTINHQDAGSLSKHAASCPCAGCSYSRLAKGKTPQEDKMHLATANALHHGDLASKHSRLAYAYRYEGDNQGPELTVEQKAKHLMAQSAHADAQDHFREASRAFRDGLPMGANEHMKIAQAKAAKANKMSEELGVK